MSSEANGAEAYMADERIIAHTTELLGRGEVHHWRGCSICSRFWRLPFDQQVVAIGEASRRVLALNPEVPGT